MKFVGFQVKRISIGISKDKNFQYYFAKLNMGYCCTKSYDSYWMTDFQNYKVPNRFSFTHFVTNSNDNIKVSR